MDFKDASQISKELNDQCNYHEEKLNDYTNKKTKELNIEVKNGFIPDIVRKTEEYKLLKENFQRSFKALQQFNQYYSKTFKKELALERKMKRRK